jgi:hypothetical protein
MGELIVSPRGFYCTLLGVALSDKEERRLYRPLVSHSLAAPPMYLPGPRGGSCTLENGVTRQ